MIYLCKTHAIEPPSVTVERWLFIFRSITKALGVDFGRGQPGHVPPIIEKRQCFHQVLPSFSPPRFWLTSLRQWQKRWLVALVYIGCLCYFVHSISAAQGRPSPWDYDAFPPCFRFPSISEKCSDFLENFNNFTLSRKISRLSSAKITDDLFF